MGHRPFLLSYSHLGCEVRAFSTMRQGGVSEGNYAAFNINRYCGDSEAHVLENRAMLCRELDISDDCLIMPHQTHQTRVAQIDELFLSLPQEERQQALEGIDALMTHLKGVCIGVSTADCIPLLLHDPEHHAVCAIHAGWRGTVARIAEAAVRAMVQTYGSRPEAILAQIGPGIRLESFEVGQEVYDAFDHAGFNMDLISKRKVKWHIDLPACNRLQLINLGLMQSHISDCGICTFRHADNYFSARRLGIHSGRIFTGICLS